LGRLDYLHEVAYGVDRGKVREPQSIWRLE
jgi:hypothetical protein